jgi:NitT/TauT family transport system substrate-binding protein
VLGLIVLLQTLTLAVSGPATSPEYLPIWVAAHDGHFARAGLTVRLRPTRSEVGAAEALAQGQADLVATSVEAMLRFGARDAQSPRLVLGLTAAPPVALVVDAPHAVRVRAVADLAGHRIGIAAPGVAEHAWLHFLLARAGLKPTEAQIVSAGSQGLGRALASGEVHAAVLPDALAAALLGEQRVVPLADLRTPAAAEQALGIPTVSAAVFVRRERRPGERELAAFVRAIAAAQGRLAGGRVAELAAKLPGAVVGEADEFEARVRRARGLYLPEGRVSEERLELTTLFLRDQLPLPSRARIQVLPAGRLTAPPAR